MTKGLFITFEGNDGAGKTTISKLVYERMLDKGYPVIYTREPGGIKIAEQIRKVILDPENIEMDAKTEALLYAASRRQHLIEKVLPAIEQGKIVLCDRFIDSSLAYQGVGRQLGIKEVFEINQFAIEGHMPDATVFLSLPPETGLSRIKSRAFKDRLDQETESFHQRVALGYEQILKQFAERMHIVDASQSIDKVAEQAYEEVIGVLKHVV
ncbi:dTMP kinase [Clostridiaceae bacterium DONG20-135]|uniref:Thymidylate kinase n=1 Tax=Copranaerobaculum intestinale TaxID=2692629 RepID=A0A6N8U335_9FIRM|nr:dTMP kinase [Copranaerobaculum intestinale]MXQ72622.1 dTMP kinase [Copranaerobaculum intestinale]